jgi:ribonuclease PH
VTRPDGRALDELRPVHMELGVQEHPAGSVLVSFGKTRVICAASIEESIPRWLRGGGQGWVTAEYAMLPGATDDRTRRDSTRGKIGGRTHEIQRLIGRSLRSAIDLTTLGENSIVVDCDVLQADGGTRTAAITGGWVALSLALDTLHARGLVSARPPLEPVSAVSVGVVDGDLRLDLCYLEDAAAGTDMNVVMAGDGRFVEVQGTAEGTPFSRAEMDRMLDLAAKGCRELVDHQRATLDTAGAG